MADEKAHVEAVKALLTAAGAAPYTLQDLKDAKPFPTSYNEVHVMQKVGIGPRRAGAPAESTQWRVLIRSVAQRYGNAQQMRSLAHDALHEAKLTVAGEDFFIEHAVTDDPIGEDSDWWSGTSEFGY